MRRGVAVSLLLISAAACSRPAPRFSLDNARAHVQMLAGTIGSRPIGTPENARARQYIVDQLRLYGFDVRVQEADARRAAFGRTAHVSNVIAVKAGAERGALGIMSHYDSVPEAPGAADDAHGVAVALEAARVLGASQRRHTLFILVTDGEEMGLMGAAALTADRGVMDRLQAYINLDSIGASGPALLFETGPSNGWIVKPWARSAPHPRGDSYSTEIYKRLPNDTDFSILRRQEIPGLNFAVIGDSYPYHTARDTADRLADSALRLTGENVVQTAAALDAMDLGARTTVDDPTFFDIGQTVGVSWGPVTTWFIAALALATGLLAWFKALTASVRLAGLGRWILDVVWTLLGVAAVAGAMIGGTWALRAARAVYHPWYARPHWMLLMILALGTIAGWGVTRLGALLPARAHGPRHPILVWSMTLPVWIVFAGVGAVLGPSAAYLWTLPLLAAGAGLLLIPADNVPAVRAVSVVALAVAGTLWLRGAVDFLGFIVALLGRLPIITPVWAFAAVLLSCAAVVVPPLIASVAALKPLARPPIITAALLVVVVVTAGFAFAAPAYTYDRPQRRSARVLVDAGATTATYEVASQEPGLDLDTAAPGGWSRVSDAPKFSVPISRFSLPFVFRTTAPPPGPAPAAISVFTLKSIAGGTELTMTIVPQTPGLTATFVLPDGVIPARSNFPGTNARGRWRATYIGIPSDGVTWTASFKSGVEAKLPAAVAVIASSRFPGGAGWQSLPAWLPQEHAVWRMDILWVVPPPAVIPPVPPIR